MKKSYSLKQILCTIYLGVIFVIYPLFEKNHYYEMGVNKYKFYLWSTIVFFVLLGISIITDPDTYKSKRKPSGKAKNTSKKAKTQVVEEPQKELNFFQKLWSGFKALPAMEKSVLLYAIIVVISYIMSVDKYMGFWGADGWQMGLLIQACILGGFYAIFYAWEKDEYPIVFLLFGSFIVFLLGFLHRFNIDPLNMYEGLDEGYMLDFLSTIGQATWYSSYVCTLFPVGLVLFLVTKNSTIKKIAAAYSVVAFATICTQNSDSAFAAVFAVFLLFLWRAFDGKEELKELFEAALLMSATFTVVGLLQRAMADRILKLDDLSFFMTKGPLMPAFFVLVGVIYLVLFKVKSIKILDKIYTARKALNIIRIVIYGLIAVSVVGYVVFIILNTAGAFGEPIDNKYLLIDDYWGNWRGFHWKLTAQMYADFPWYRKLFGAGPDCFEAMTTQYYPYNEIVAERFDGQVLSCAHNEFYNMIICYGGLGAIAYISIFVSSFVTFVKASKKEPLFLAVAASIVSYAMHNFFCYQTICCTPFLFLILAVGAKWLKSKSRY